MTRFLYALPSGISVTDDDPASTPTGKQCRDCARALPAFGGRIRCAECHRRHRSRTDVASRHRRQDDDISPEDIERRFAAAKAALLAQRRQRATP